MSAQIEAWFATDRPRQDVLRALRSVLRDLGLAEALKWRQPCYMAEGRNIAILGARKDGCVVTLFAGALLDDPDGHLLSAGPNTRVARILRFTSVQDVGEREAVLRCLLRQAIALAPTGRPAEAEPTTEPVPVELRQHLSRDPELRAAFEVLTAGRRRSYLLHFGAAKRASTLTARVEGARSRILAGKGPHDCICGRSGHLPRCDGSHRKS